MINEHRVVQDLDGWRRRREKVGESLRLMTLDPIKVMTIAKEYYAL